MIFSTMKIEDQTCLFALFIKSTFGIRVLHSWYQSRSV